jgi:hypothetical protein
MRKVTFTAVILLVAGAVYTQNYHSNTTLPGKTDSGVLEKQGKSALQNVVIVYKTHFDIGYSVYL